MAESFSNLSSDRCQVRLSLSYFLLLFPMQEYSRLRELGIETGGLEATLLNSPRSGEGAVGASTSAPAKDSQPESGSKGESSSTVGSEQVPLAVTDSVPVPNIPSFTAGREYRRIAGVPVYLDVVDVGPGGRPRAYHDWLEDIQDAVERDEVECDRFYEAERRAKAAFEAGTSSTGVKPTSEVSTISLTIVYTVLLWVFI